MKEIKWIYLLDNRGSPSLVYNNKDNEMEKPSYSILSHFLFGLKLNSRDSEIESVKIMDIENDRFYLIDDNTTGSTFIINSSWLMESKKIKTILDKIVNTYKKHFGGQESTNVQKKQEIFQAFKEDIELLFKK